MLMLSSNLTDQASLLKVLTDAATVAMESIMLLLLLVMDLLPLTQLAKITGLLEILGVLHGESKASSDCAWMALDLVQLHMVHA
jgi:hypothetical protein